MTSALDHLEKVLDGRRAPTQRAVLCALLGGHHTAASIAEEIGTSENAVAVALHELTKHGAVDRVGRGRYEPRETLIALALIARVEKLEEEHRRA